MANITDVSADESTLRKNYIEPVYQETIQRIKEKVSDCDVGIMLDETTHSMDLTFWSFL